MESPVGELEQGGVLQEPPVCQREKKKREIMNEKETK